MKKIICLLLSLIFIFVMSVSAFADEAVISMTASKTSCVKGDEITFTVSLANCAESKSIALVFDYDLANTFEIIEGKWLLDGAIIANFDTTMVPKGAAAITYMANRDMNGNIFTLTLKVKESATFGEKEIKVTPTVTNANDVVLCSKEATVKVTIANPATAIDLPATAEVEEGGTKKLTATLTPSDATSTVTWSSNNTGVATVGTDGTVTGVAAGKATITATANGYSDTCEVTVKHVLGSLVQEEAATCEKAGMAAHYVCGKCGAFFTEGKVETTEAALKIAKLAHHGVAQNAGQAASCTADGWKDYYKCDKGCDGLFADEACKTPIADLAAWKTGAGKIPMGAHGGDETAEVPATCTEAGHKAYFFCTGCKQYFSKENVLIGAEGDLTTWLAKDGDGYIEPLGHDLAHVDAEAPACAAGGVHNDGVKEYWKCSRKDCGACFEDAKGESAIDDIETWKTGEGKVEWTEHTGTSIEIIKKAATCTEDGEKVHVCSICGDELDNPYPYRDPDAHQWGPWTVEKQPTVKENGLEKRICEKCQKEETREIKKLQPKGDPIVIGGKEEKKEEGKESNPNTGATLYAGVVAMAALSGAAVLALRKKH